MKKSSRMFFGCGVCIFFAGVFAELGFKYIAGAELGITLLFLVAAITQYLNGN